MAKADKEKAKVKPASVTTAKERGTSPENAQSQRDKKVKARTKDKARDTPHTKEAGKVKEVPKKDAGHAEGTITHPNARTASNVDKQGHCKLKP